MVEQLRRPTEQVEVFWFSEQPNGWSCTSSLRLIPAPPKSGTMLPYHTIVRGHYHDSAPC